MRLKLYMTAGGRRWHRLYASPTDPDEPPSIACNPNVYHNDWWRSVEVKSKRQLVELEPKLCRRCFQ